MPTNQLTDRGKDSPPPPLWLQVVLSLGIAQFPKRNTIYRVLKRLLVPSKASWFLVLVGNFFQRIAKRYFSKQVSSSSTWHGSMRRVHVTLKTPPKLSGHSAGVHCCAVKWCACSYIQCWSWVQCNAAKWRACVVCMGRAGMNIPAPLLFGIMQTRKKCRKKISNTSVHAMKL